MTVPFGTVEAGGQRRSLSLSVRRVKVTARDATRIGAEDDAVGKRTDLGTIY